ncbi:MAG: hypothetical protein HC894_13640 [Microcoleus sp. SM1_3_4]|nr:hypothetical protein [Microcoleus sp. SM1_3_4]
MAFLGGLFGFKKSEYFLDLDASPAKEPAKVAPAKAEPVAAPAVAAAPANAKTEPAKKTKLETAKKSKKEAASAPAPAPTPAKVPAASTNGKVPATADGVVTFAPNYLAPTPTANRRLPGPSMNGFREMARQVKTK